MTRFLLLLLVTHTRAAPLDPQVEQRELHSEAKAHHRFAAWAESHGWHQDGPHHEQKSEHNDERGDNMPSAAPLLTATQTDELSCLGVCKSDADCTSGCVCSEPEGACVFGGPTLTPTQNPGPGSLSCGEVCYSNEVDRKADCTIDCIMEGLPPYYCLC